MKWLLSISVIALVASTAVAEPVWEVLEAPPEFHWWEVRHLDEIDSNDPFADFQWEKEGPEPLRVVANDPGIVGEGELYDLRDLLIHEGVNLAENDLVLLNAATNLVYVRVLNSQSIAEIQAYLGRFGWRLDQENLQTEATALRVPDALWEKIRDGAVLTSEERKEWLSQSGIEPLVFLPILACFGQEATSRIEYGKPGQDPWIEGQFTATGRFEDTIQLAFGLKLTGRLQGEPFHLALKGSHTCQDGMSILRKGPPGLALLLRPLSVPIRQPGLKLEELTQQWRERGPKLTLEPGHPMGGYTENGMPADFRSSVPRVQAYATTPDLVMIGADGKDRVDPYPRVELSAYRKMLGEGPIFDLRELFELNGVDFPEGAWAVINTATATLYVRTTIDQLELIEAYVQPIGCMVAKTLHYRISFLDSNKDSLHTMSLTSRSGQWSKCVSQLPPLGRLEVKTDSVIGADGVTIDCVLTLDGNFHLADGTSFQYSSKLPLTCRADIPMTIPVFDLPLDPGKTVTLHFEPRLRSIHTGRGHGLLREVSYLVDHWWDEMGAQMAESEDLQNKRGN